MARVQKSGTSPNFVPRPYSRGRKRDAYLTGWSYGHGIACHNVPELGKEYWTQAEGRMVCDAENIAEIHQALCFGAAEHQRCYSPWEFVAHEFNSALEHESEAMWEAYDAGEADAIFADLRGYTYEG